MPSEHYVGLQYDIINFLSEYHSPHTLAKFIVPPLLSPSQTEARLNNIQDGFEVLMVVTTKMAVFWAVAPCTLVIALIMEAARTSGPLKR
jgi:hypothetical protein